MDVAIGEHGKPSKDLSTPYCDYIRALLPAYPQLQILDDFVQDADWTKWEAFGQPKPAGLTKFDVVIFDIEIHGDAERKTRLHQSGTLRSEAETESYIEAHPLTQRDSVRLFLVEDLSRAVVEYFGAKYKLDPQVFESHLKGQERLKSGRPLYEYRLAARPSPPTNSDYCTRHHFSVDYIRPYKFGDGTENSWKVVQRKRWQTANVIRNGDAYLPIKSSDAYYSRERFSVAYISNREEGPKLGILLFDPILPLDQPRTLPGYRNFLPIPIFGSANEGSPSNDIGHFSLRNDFLDWLSHLSGADLQIYAQSFGAHNLSLLSHLFRVAAANAIDTFEEIRDTIEFVELRIHGYWRDMKVDIDEKKACDCIQILRYFITDSLECMDAILVTLKGRFRCSTGVVMQSQSMIQLADAMRQQSREGCFDLAREQLISDCEAITSNLGDLKSRAETDINYFVARISAKEVEKTGEQSNQLQLLNYIVFILGLISALAAILAIEKRSKYTLAFVIASTLAIITIVIAKSFRHIHAFAMRGLQIIGGMRKKSDQDGNPFDFVQVCSLYRVKSS